MAHCRFDSTSKFFWWYWCRWSDSVTFGARDGQLGSGRCRFTWGCPSLFPAKFQLQFGYCIGRRVRDWRGCLRTSSSFLFLCFLGPCTLVDHGRRQKETKIVVPNRDVTKHRCLCEQLWRLHCTPGLNYFWSIFRIHFLFLGTFPILNWRSRSFSTHQKSQNALISSS